MTRKFVFGLALLAIATSVVSCFDPDRVPGGPPRGYETSDRECSDGRDNDQDGLADCQDPDCIGRWQCGEVIPLLPVGGVENSLRLCIDRIDNDLDGQFDCGDRDCQGINELCCVTEFSDVRCSDGVDNDGNGFIDCADFSCRRGLFVTVCDRETECDDGEDNDGDRRVDCDDRDCAADLACTDNPPEMGDENTVERCMDGFDNDGNNFVDCADFSCCGDRQCTRPIDPAIGIYCESIQENNVERCTDGIDNDDNGFADCREFGCCPRDQPNCIDSAVDAFCAANIPEDTLERCTNGIDDDGNGFIDCDDFSCSRADTSPDAPISSAMRIERSMIRQACEATFSVCNDGIDNDNDGFVDCADFSCQGFVTFDRDGEARSACLESLRAPGDLGDTDPVAALQEAQDACSDGNDNDNDGFVDCDDWDCQWNPLLNPIADDPSSTAQGFCQGWINPTGTEWIPAPPSSSRPVVPLLCD